MRFVHQYFTHRSTLYDVQPTQKGPVPNKGHNPTKNRRQNAKAGVNLKCKKVKKEIESKARSFI